MLNRREWLRCSGLLMAPLMAPRSRAAETRLDKETVERSPASAKLADDALGERVEVERRWEGPYCRASVVNRGARAVRVKEVLLFQVEHNLPGETRLYGESFQMLSQTGGTLAAPVHYAYDEQKHYRIPQPQGLQAALTGMMTLQTPDGLHTVLAFTSCRRFIGRFYVRPGSLEAILDTEGLELAPGERWELEEFAVFSGDRRSELLARLAARMNQNHPPRRFPAPPTGWCSWYCFGPRVTASQVLANLDVISKDIPELRYVQIDDGYQPAMGDWLDSGKAFGGDIQGVLKQIRQRGFEPAIWVAPFIAEKGSKLFAQHPGWFMKGPEGDPLPSDKVTFGGWRRGPWYALDGTHPEVQRHLESLFRTLRHDWGCTYFKLDANFWGAMHGAVLHDPKATRIEAYRRGMAAILRGAGDAFVLGCNHPIWPSLGLIDGSRSSGDVKRTWTTLRKIARENLSRNWQNGRLWWNDPDAIVLTGDLPENEFVFHATAVYASGGLILSGDDLTQMPPPRRNMLRKLLPPTGIAAEFEDSSLRVGQIQLPGKLMLCVFNWDDNPSTLRVQLPREAEVKDFWTGEHLGRRAGELVFENMPGRSARLLECV